MAKTIEVWKIEPDEGKTLTQQKTRLKEWKKVFLAQGAAAVVIYEGGYGDTASWEVHVHHKSAADFGKYKDKFTNNARWHAQYEKWQKAGVLQPKSGGLIHETNL